MSLCSIVVAISVFLLSVNASAVDCSVQFSYGMYVSCSLMTKIMTPALMHSSYEGRSKSFATQYDAQMTQAKFLCYYSI